MRPSEEFLDELDFARCYRALYNHAYPGDTDYGKAQTMGPYLRGSIAFRHEALVWLTDPESSWPPDPDADPGYRPALKDGVSTR